MIGEVFQILAPNLTKKRSITWHLITPTNSNPKTPMVARLVVVIVTETTPNYPLATGLFNRANLHSSHVQSLCFVCDVRKLSNNWPRPNHYSTDSKQAIFAVARS